MSGKFGAAARPDILSTAGISTPFDKYIEDSRLAVRSASAPMPEPPEPVREFVRNFMAEIRAGLS
jgi:hypothetical protein